LVARVQIEEVHLRAVQRSVDFGEGLSNATEERVHDPGEVQAVAEAQSVNLKRCVP